jgi:ABC-2 type transport system permease protein
MSGELEGVRALVTGGASGIGLAIARALRDRGATVAVLDRDVRGADGFVAVQADVTDDAAVRSAVGAAVERLGGLDVLCNNAGIGAQGDVTANDDDEWLKLRTTRTPWLLLAASLVVIVAGVAGVMARSPDLGDPATVAAAMGHVGLVSLFTLVLGVLAVAGEHRHGTATDTYLSEPRRGRVLAAKLVVTTLAGAALGVAAAVAGLAATAAWYAAEGGSLDLTSAAVARTTLGGVGWCAAFAAIGVGVGALVRNLAGAVTAALAWLALVEGVAGDLVGDDLAQWLPFRAGTALGNLPAATGEAALGQGAAAAALVAYAVLLAALAVSTTVRRDVS